MKKIIYLIIVAFIFISCKDDTDCCLNLAPVNITLKFTHKWNEIPVNASDFNEFKFTNENGEIVSLDKLRYVISTITLGEKIKEYNLVDVKENSGTEITFSNVTIGLKELKFRFGFSDEDNQDGVYQDLNSVNFGVPAMLGGGYHYMQFDGKYKDINSMDANFNYHTIRAADRTNSNPWNNLPDTSFLVDFGMIEITKDATIEINMNIAEWFKNPNTWNLNELNTVLMPNFEAQKLMNENGKTVFTLGGIN